MTCDLLPWKTRMYRGLHRRRPILYPEGTPSVDRRNQFLKQSSKPRDGGDEGAESVKGWAGKRLCVDLNVQKVWTEEIPGKTWNLFGGRGLNANSSPKERPFGPSSSDRNPLVFGTGPLGELLLPAQAWTSVSILSPYTDPPSMPR